MGEPSKPTKISLPHDDERQEEPMLLTSDLSLRKFLNSDKFSDCEIHVGNLVFKCHKVVLAASSPYLDEVCAPFMWTDQMLILTLPPHLDTTLVFELLEFIYCNVVETFNSDDLFPMGEALRIRGFCKSKVLCPLMPVAAETRPYPPKIKVTSSEGASASAQVTREDTEVAQEDSESTEEQPRHEGSEFKVESVLASHSYQLAPPNAPPSNGFSTGLSFDHLNLGTPPTEARMLSFPLPTDRIPDNKPFYANATFSPSDNARTDARTSWHLPYESTSSSPREAHSNGLNHMPSFGQTGDVFCGSEGTSSTFGVSTNPYFMPARSRHCVPQCDNQLPHFNAYSRDAAPLVTSRGFQSALSPMDMQANSSFQGQSRLSLPASSSTSVVVPGLSVPPQLALGPEQSQIIARLRLIANLIHRNQDEPDSNGDQDPFAHG